MTTEMYVGGEQVVTVSETKFLYVGEGHANLPPIMIRLVVKEVAMKEGITTPFELAAKTKLPYESCRLMWMGTSKRIDLKSIEKICTVLNVRPGQLFDFEPESLTAIKPEMEKRGRKKR